MDMRIEGMADLEKQLKDLEKSLNPDKVEPILLDGAKDLAAAMKANAPKGPTGNLKKSIKAKLLKQYAGHPAAGAGVDRKKAPHAHLVEYGTAQRHQKSGKSTGTMPSKPFLRPAWDANKERITGNIIDGLKGLIDKCL